METVYIGHTFVTVENCEDAWNESVDGDVTAALDTSDYCVGSGSAKFICATGLGAGDLIATEAISSLDISASTWVSLWIKSTVALNAGDIQLLLDEHAVCASPSETLNIPAVSANVWTRVAIVLAGASADRNAIISVGLKQVVDKAAFTLNVDDIQAFTGKTYEALAVRGITDPDDIELNSAAPVKLLDGSYFANDVPSYNRRITISMGPVLVKADRIHLLSTWKKSTIRVIAQGDEATVCRTTETFGNEWLEGLDFAKSFTWDLLRRQQEQPIPQVSPRGHHDRDSDSDGHR